MTIERLDRELMMEILERLIRLEDRLLAPGPLNLTYPKAAARLGVGLTKLKEMVKGGKIRPALIGEVKMIPVSELHRISMPEDCRPKHDAKVRAAAWVPIPRKRG